MTHINKLSVEQFKGLPHFSCEFDEDFTVLSGLNNAGKSSLLQAVYLCSALLTEAAPLFAGSDSPHFQLDRSLEHSRSRLGIPTIDWLLHTSGAAASTVLSAEFSGQLSIVARFSGDQASLKIEAPMALSECMPAIHALGADFFRPPGMLPATEAFQPGPEYKRHVASGNGGQHWRNGLYWQVQRLTGPSEYDSVVSRISGHFPDVKIHYPSLSDDRNPPNVLIRYSDATGKVFDIAQSGSGLHTFLALVQLVESSASSIILLDEPDSHLHASQQGIITDILVRLSSERGKQIILATHSAEIIKRAPLGTVLWIERGATRAQGGIEDEVLLSRLGVSASNAFILGSFPSVIVYVEGDGDQPTIERLIRWCIRHSKQPLPTVKVVRHQDGKFNAVALQAISRTAAECGHTTHVIGIRDLDWDYTEFNELPPTVTSPVIRSGKGYTLVTLPCKEIENLYCHPDVIFAITKDPRIEGILDEVTLAPDLLTEWSFHAMPQIRERLSPRLAVHTREKEAAEEFKRWCEDPMKRRSLLSGKALLGRLRQRVPLLRKGLPRLFDDMDRLCGEWITLARTLFPSLSEDLFLSPPQAPDDPAAPQVTHPDES